MRIEERDYQCRIVEKIVRSFTVDRYRNVMVESPTGSGKTVMAMLSLDRLMKDRADMRVAWTAMRRNLLGQARQTAQAVGLDMDRITFVSMFDRRPPRADMLVVDEAQHDAAATCAQLHSMVGAEWSLGLTATPFRTDRIRLAYEKVIRDCGIRFLIDKGYLAPFEQYALEKYCPRTVADAYLRDRERWGRSLMFFVDSDSCREAVQLIRAGGARTEMLMGTDPTARRDEVLDAFDEGRLDVLVNVYLLTEGYDCPALKTVWVRDSGKLPTIQMSGRVLRPGKVARVVQSANTRYPFSRSASPLRQFVQTHGQWRELGEGTATKAVADKVMNQLWKRRRADLPSVLSGNNKFAGLLEDD